MSDQQIQLTTDPNQTWDITLTVNGSPLTLAFRLYYNEMAQCWVMDISDQLGNPIITSTPLLTGVWPAANLLCQNGYLRIGASYILNKSNATMDWMRGRETEYLQDYPDDKNLGVDYVMIWGDNPS